MKQLTNQEPGFVPRDQKEQWGSIVLQFQCGRRKCQPIRKLDLDHVTSPRWRFQRKSAMLENSPPASTEDWGRSHGFPWRHNR